MHPTKSPACVITAKEQYLQALIKEIEMRADLTPD
jgi:hypothetical protein